MQLAARGEETPRARRTDPLFSLVGSEGLSVFILHGYLSRERGLPSDCREGSVHPSPGKGLGVSAHSTCGGRAGITPAFLSITREHNRVHPSEEGPRGRAFTRSVLESFCRLQRFLRYL